MKKTILAILSLGAVSLAGVNGQTVITSWNFFGQNSTTLATSNPYLTSPNLTSSTLSRGAGAAASAGTNSFRTQGFGNSTLDLTSNRYFQFSLTPQTGYTLSITSLNANMAGTASFSNSPGTSNQFTFSLDGTNFTAIGTPTTRIGNGYLGAIDTTGITALQNVAENTTVTFRFFAVGLTSTGGWGFTSGNATTAADGLIVTGSVVPEPTTWALIGLGSAFVLWRIRSRRKTT